MSEVSSNARKIRKFILDSFLADGRAPNIGEIAASLGLSHADILNAFQEIGKIDTFWVEKGTENIRILSPFSNLTTPYRVTIAGEQKWYAVCGIEALSLGLFFLGQEVHVDGYCRDCGDPIRLHLKDSEIHHQEPEGLVAHLGVPVARWLEDLPFV